MRTNRAKGPRASRARRAAVAGVACAALAVGLAASSPALAGEARLAAAVPARYELRALDGATTRVESLRGGVVVMNFWASWCKPCRVELPQLDAWSSEVAGSGVQVIAVSVDRDADRAARFVADSKLSLPVYHDGPAGLAKILDLPHLPCTVILDREGQVAHVTHGAGAAAVAEVQRAVGALLAASRGAGVHVAGGGRAAESGERGDQ
jgi:thiol-disulfide isomerase/thioredoxin